MSRRPRNLEVCNVLLNFEFYSDNQSAENIFITGSLDSLQSWSPDNALALSSANYPTWSSKSHAFCVNAYL